MSNFIHFKPTRPTNTVSKEASNPFHFKPTMGLNLAHNDQESHSIITVDLQKFSVSFSLLITIGCLIYSTVTRSSHVLSFEDVIFALWDHTHTQSWSTDGWNLTFDPVAHCSLCNAKTLIHSFLWKQKKRDKNLHKNKVKILSCLGKREYFSPFLKEMCWDLITVCNR